ncbi:uro-adherence factor A-like [Mytilus edulis]|uniref:uro-adherence factor A-like n=1 Tax=Mytilus edulis TaxID=6550 RepID=UPI0039EF5628
MNPSWGYEEGVYNLQEICYKHPPPVVVHCDIASSEVTPGSSSFDLSQPLLIYRQRNINKINAQNVQRDLFRETGPPLVIPEDYKGWFAVLQKKRINPATLGHNVMEYKLVSDLSNSDTETFLIGGSEQVHALQVSISCDGKSQHQQRGLFPGEVLRKGKIYVGESKRKSGIFRRSKLKQEYYLLCTDECEREILLPFNQKGVFYTLTTQSVRMPCPVLHMKDILDKKYLPATTKLLFGRMPIAECGFTGILRLEHSHFERSVIACTTSEKNIFVELPINCSLKFRIFEMNDDVVQSDLYKRAFALCNEKAYLYMSGIKVNHSINETVLSEDEVATDLPPSPHILRTKKQDTSTDDNRESGYIEMRDSLELSEEASYIDMKESLSCSSSISIDFDEMDYVLPSGRNSLHNSLRRSNSRDNSKTNTLTKHQSYRSPPPVCSPPPLPTACAGSPDHSYIDLDSGISDGIPTNTSRDRVSVRIDKVHSDKIYDIPRIPRRLSAPEPTDMYAMSVTRPTSLDIVPEANLGEAINYENFSILREVVPKPCGTLRPGQTRKPLEPIYSDVPSNTSIHHVLEPEEHLNDSQAKDTKTITTVVVKTETLSVIQDFSNNNCDVKTKHKIENETPSFVSTNDKSKVPNCEDDEKILNEEINAPHCPENENTSTLNEKIDVPHYQDDEITSASNKKIDVPHFPDHEITSALNEKIDVLKCQDDENISTLNEEIDVPQCQDDENTSTLNAEKDVPECQGDDQVLPLNEKIDVTHGQNNDKVSPLHEGTDISSPNIAVAREKQLETDKNEKLDENESLCKSETRNQILEQCDEVRTSIDTKHDEQTSESESMNTVQSTRIADVVLSESTSAVTELISSDAPSDDIKINLDTKYCNTKWCEHEIEEFNACSNHTIITTFTQDMEVNSVKNKTSSTISKDIVCELDSSITNDDNNMSEQLIKSLSHVCPSTKNNGNDIELQSENIASALQGHASDSYIKDHITTSEYDKISKSTPFNIVSQPFNTKDNSRETSIEKLTINVSHMYDDVQATVTPPPSACLVKPLSGTMSDNNFPTSSHQNAEHKQIPNPDKSVTSFSITNSVKNESNSEIDRSKTDTKFDSYAIKASNSCFENHEQKSAPVSGNINALDEKQLSKSSNTDKLMSHFENDKVQGEINTSKCSELEVQSAKMIKQNEVECLDKTKEEMCHVQSIIHTETVVQETKISDNSIQQPQQSESEQTHLKTFISEGQNSVVEIVRDNIHSSIRQSNHGACQETNDAERETVSLILENVQSSISSHNSPKSDNESLISNIHEEVCNERIEVKIDDEDDFCNISTSEIVAGFKKLGIRKSVIDIVQQRSLRGSNLKDNQNLGEIFPGISCIDKRKISMFLQGMMQSSDSSGKHNPTEPIWV